MRLTTAIEMKFPTRQVSSKQGLVLHTRMATLYFGGDQRLFKDSETTKRRMLEICKKASQTELTFWRKVLRSKKTTRNGLRAAMQRVRGLSDELGADKETLKEDEAVFCERFKQAGKYLPYPTRYD